MGFDVTNDLFANHSWYFRNALVRANYQNVQKGIMRNSEYLERFFRNLLLGENNELRNRYMVVNASEELTAKQVQQIDRTSTEQPTIQVTEQVRALLLALSYEQLSLKVLMKKVGLKHRPTFLENYISPASEAGFLKVLYPDKPNHPRQKYLLTAKGLALYNEIRKMQLITILILQMNRKNNGVILCGMILISLLNKILKQKPCYLKKMKLYKNQLL